MLALTGEVSRFGDVIDDTGRELAVDATVVEILRTGHWMAEENPESLVDSLTGYLVG